MMRTLLTVVALTGVLVACTGPAATTAPTSAPTGATTSAPTSAPTADGEGAVCDNLPANAAGDLLEAICEAGVIRVATDPAYPPQSELLPDGSFEGFDIDTANAIAERLGVEVQFETPNFDEVVAGSWGERFDISVGSVTITTSREDLLSFTQPYYYTPAQMAATETSGITTLDGLAGQVVCVGDGTTYFQWLEGTLALAGDVPEPAPAPEGVQSTTFSTDTECADAVVAGRTEFQGWLTASPTLFTSIDGGAPFVLVGEPVFFEALAVAADKAGPPSDALIAALDQIIADMHADGTLTESSLSWFTDGEGNPLDYTKAD